jgi:hypothetical protein
VFPGFVKVSSSKSTPEETPKMLTGKWPLPEATIYTKVLRQGMQSDTNDLGVSNIMSVEPGLGPRYSFDFAVGTVHGTFDPVAAWRFGWAFSVPLSSEFVPCSTMDSSRSFFGVDQSNVVLINAKPEVGDWKPGIITTPPPKSQARRGIILRLQEIAGRETRGLVINLPGRARNAELLNLTEENVVQSNLPVNPVRVDIGAFRTITLRIVPE